MPVNSVNSVSFGRAKNGLKNSQNERADAYYKWVSQNAVIESLKLSKGREVENGKLSAAAFGVKMAGFMSAMISLLVFSGSKEQSAAKMKSAFAGMTASMGAIAVGYLIDNYNHYKAEKTAHERGFFNLRDRQKIKKTKDLYALTEDTYNFHVR